MQLSRSIMLAVAFTIAVPCNAHECGEAAPAKVMKNVFGIADKRIALATLILFAICYIRLTTKSSPKEKIERSWGEYFAKLASLLNVTQIGTSEYWNTADSVIIGNQFKLIEKSTRTKEANGEIVTLKTKVPKALPSGMFGYFDAYVLQNLKTLFENIKNLTEAKGYGDGVLW